MSRLRPTPQRRTRRDEQGAVLPLVALLIAALVTMTSFAVDLGRARLRARDLQAVADVAALDLSNRLVATPAEQVDGIHHAVPSTANAQLADVLRTTIAPRNGFTATTSNSSVLVGWWEESTRSLTLYPPSDNTSEKVNAASVSLSDTVGYLFRPGSKDLLRNAAASLGKLLTHTCDAGACPPPPVDKAGHAWVSVGSFLADLNAQTPSQISGDPGSTCGSAGDLLAPGLAPSGVLNCTISASYGLSGLPSGALQLTSLGYQGLASSRASLLDLATILTAGDVDRLLSTDIKRTDLLIALATLAQRDGHSEAATPLLSFASTLQANGALSAKTQKLGDLLGLTTSTGQGSVASSQLSLLTLLAAGSEAMNGASFLSAPVTLGSYSVAGIATPVTAKVQTAIVQPAQARWLAPNDGKTAETSQVRTLVTLDFDVVGLGHVTLPITVSAADAKAGMTALRGCDAATATDLLPVRDDLHAVTKGLTATIEAAGSLTRSITSPSATGSVDLTAVTPVGIITLGLSQTVLGITTTVNVPINAKAGYGIAGTTTDALDLIPASTNPADYTRTVGQPAVDLGQQLLSTLQLSPGVSVPAALQALLTSSLATLNPALQAVLSTVQANVLDPVLSSVGVRVAGADVASFGPACDPVP